MIGFVSTWLTPPLRRFWIIGAAGVLVVLAVASGVQQQTRQDVFNPGASLDKTAAIFETVHEQIPQLPENGVLFFVLDEDKPSPLGWGFGVYDLSCAMFGIPAYQGSFSPETGWLARSITNYPPPDAPDATPYNFEDHTVLAFRVTFEGEATRLELPSDIQTPDDAIPPSPCFRTRLAVTPGEPLPFLGQWADEKP